MNLSTTYFSLFLFTISFIPHASTSLPSSIKLYEVVCRDSGKANFDRCLELLEDSPKITSAKDYLNLSKFILKMGIEKSKQSQGYFNEMRNKYPFSQAIKWCATRDYGAFVKKLELSLRDLVEFEDPMTAKYDARVSGDSLRDCQRALYDEKIVDPSISTLNDEMMLLSSIAYLAIKHI